MEDKRIAFIGAGMMGQRAHLEQYASWPDCRIVALAEPRRGLAAEVAARYGIPQVFQDHRALLDHVDVDGFVCIQPYAHHRSILPDIYKTGKPVITEKPLALSVEAGTELVALAAASGAQHMVGYHKRSDPAMEYAIRVIREWQGSGSFGSMTYIRATMPPGDWTWNGFAGLLTSREAYPAMVLEDPAIMTCFNPEQAKAYDTFVNYYIHQVNAIRFLLGCDYQVDFADQAGHLLIGHGFQGTSVVLEMAPWQNSLDWQESYLVCFEKGSVLIELPAPLASQQAGRVRIMRDNGSGQPGWEIPMLPALSAMRSQARHFLDLVGGTSDAPCRAPEALKDLELARDYILMHTKRRWSP